MAGSPMSRFRPRTGNSNPASSGRPLGSWMSWRDGGRANGRHAAGAGHSAPRGLPEMASPSLLPVLTLTLEGAVLRLYPEWKEDERGRQVGAVWGITLVNATVLGGLLLLAIPPAWPLAIRS